MHLLLNYVFLTTVGFPLLMSCPTSWKMLLQLMLLSREPLFTMTATASRICSRTYFCRLQGIIARCAISTQKTENREDLSAIDLDWIVAVCFLWILSIETNSTLMIRHQLTFQNTLDRKRTCNSPSEQLVIPRSTLPFYPLPLHCRFGWN